MNDGTTNTETTGGAVAAPVEDKPTPPPMPEAPMVIPPTPEIPPTPTPLTPAETLVPTPAPEPTPPSFGSMTAPVDTGSLGAAQPSGFGTAPEEPSGSLGGESSIAGSAPVAAPTQSGGLPPPSTPEATPATTSTADTTVTKPWWHIW